MPVLRGDMTGRPEWCELESYAIRSVAPAKTRRWRPDRPANKLVVVSGRCRVGTPEGERTLDAGAALDVGPGECTVTAADGPATVVELSGHWGDDCGGVGVFRVVEVDGSEDPAAADGGDPVDYPKRTSFDRHYHDCDEYWILVSGRGVAVSEGVQHEVGPGDCVATRMGHHHDLPIAASPVLAVYFETTLRNERRRGHLWEHTHGPARTP